MDMWSFDWWGWQDWAGNFCYLILAISYLVVNIFWLRLLAIVALGLEGVYFYFASEPPLWVGIGWAFVFVAINVVQLLRLTHERYRIRHSEQERMLRKGLFRDLNTVGFNRLLGIGRWRDVDDGTVLTRENQPVEEIVLIAEGGAEVEVGGRLVATLQSGSFCGEMSFLTKENASATVVTTGSCRVFAVNKEKLTTLLEKDNDIKTAIHGVIGRDLAYKLKAVDARP
jgi:hypothetical protein